ncbi:MAG TPA: hypothetical protein VFX37_15100 [Pseudolabrys sp.]|nr:hypothetical protein [Pseudolabrys sp.]
MLQRASAKTGMGDFAQQEAEVLAGKQLLWLASDGATIEAAATTQLVNENGRRLCVIVACGGHDRARWLPLIAGIEEFARREGCSEMRVYGRKGWARVLDDYRPRYVILEKKL